MCQGSALDLEKAEPEGRGRSALQFPRFNRMTLGAGVAGGVIGAAHPLWNFTVYDDVTADVGRREGDFIYKPIPGSTVLPEQDREPENTGARS
jgi:hypothetical protein